MHLSFKWPLLFIIGNKNLILKLCCVICHARISSMCLMPIAKAERAVGPFQEPKQVAKTKTEERAIVRTQVERGWSRLQLLFGNDMKRWGKELGGLEVQPSRTNELHYVLTWSHLKASGSVPKSVPQLFLKSQYSEPTTWQINSTLTSTGFALKFLFLTLAFHDISILHF